MFYRYTYSRPKTPEMFKGSKKELETKLKSGYKISSSLPYDSYIIIRLPYGIIYEYPNAKSDTPIRHKVPNKKFVCERYGNKNVRKFCSDCFTCELRRVQELYYDYLACDLNKGLIAFDEIPAQKWE